MDNNEDDTRIYKVVTSVQGYVSIWLAHKEIPGGWEEAGKQGLKNECLEYIEQNFPHNPDMKIYRKYHNLPEE